MDLAEIERFWDEPATRSALDSWIGRGLEEDRVDGDLATQALFEAGRARARVTAVQSGVICGGPAAVAVFRRLDAATVVESRMPDGSAVVAGDEVLVIESDVHAILGGERTALNLLGHLSGIASRTREWVGLASGVQVLDTRKTLPGIRRFQKFAVRAGGGQNHRNDLAEFPMVKENHRDLFRRRVVAAGGPPPSVGAEIAEITRRLRAAAPDRPLEVEVEDFDSFLACLESGVDIVLLDNQSPETVREWIARASRERPDLDSRCELEASGGITGERLGDYAATGVSRVSLGALTHSVMALDLSLHVEWAESEEQSSSDSHDRPRKDFS